MPGYIELKIQVTGKQQKDIMVALLSDEGVNGFEEEKDVLKAFIAAEDYNETTIEKIMAQHNWQYSKQAIEETNWNAAWEAGFQPVIIDDFCAIRAAFHEPVAAARHDIIITPKMSFGTGHHATTSMMVRAMAGLDFTHKTVFDFGTGTGVLAVLAEKCGAQNVVAIDNDKWSISNARENIVVNNCHKVLLHSIDGFFSEEKYDIILANINRNIILQNLDKIKQHLSGKGVVLLSGLLNGDEQVILAKAGTQDLRLAQKTACNGWICLVLVNA